MPETLLPGSVLALSDQAADRLLRLDSGDAPGPRTGSRPHKRTWFPSAWRSRSRPRPPRLP